MKIKPFIFSVILIMIIILLVFFISDLSTHDKVLRIRDGTLISFNEMIDELVHVKIVFIGEQHDNQRHHKAQLNIIRGLKEKGIPVSLGLEMFKAEDQEILDLWGAGNLGLKSFLELYYSSWGIPWPNYRDIIIFSRDNSIPLIGLNVPDEVTKKVAHDGFQSLTPEDVKKLPPDITCDDIDEHYMDFIRTAFDMHERKGREFVYFCEAQMVWDKAMAWYLLSYMNEEPDRTVIVLSGIGHSWKRGIPEQVKRQAGHSFRVILPYVEGKVQDETITTDDADFVVF